MENGAPIAAPAALGDSSMGTRQRWPGVLAPNPAKSKPSESGRGSVPAPRRAHDSPQRARERAMPWIRTRLKIAGWPLTLRRA